MQYNWFSIFLEIMRASHSFLIQKLHLKQVVQLDQIKYSKLHQLGEMALTQSLRRCLLLIAVEYMYSVPHHHLQKTLLHTIWTAVEVEVAIVAVLEVFLLWTYLAMVIAIGLAVTHRSSMTQVVHLAKPLSEHLKGKMTYYVLVSEG